MMDTDLRDLLQAWLEDEIDEAQATRLLRRLQSDAGLRAAFVDEIVMLGRLKVVQSAEPRWLQLEDALGAAPSSREDHTDFESNVMASLGLCVAQKPPAAAPSTTRFIGPTVALIACGLLLACGVWIAARFARQDTLVGPPPPVPIGNSSGAVLTFAEQTHWEDAAPWAGTRLQHQLPYRLQAGAIRLRMQGGGIVSIAGPAAFTVLDATRIRLDCGKLAARLPDDASELLVRTGELVIRDLGTAFGVTADPEGEVDLAVFDGSVSVRSTSGVDREQTLTEGEAVSTSEGRKRRTVSFDPEFYQDIWPLTVGIDDVSNRVDFVPPGPHVSIESLADDHKLFLMPEKLNNRVTKPMTLELVRPGQAWPTSHAVPETIHPKQLVSSYLLIYNPKNSGYRDRRALSGSITFQHPILGVAVEPRQLRATDQVFGAEGVDYASFSFRRLEHVTTEEGDLPPDSLRISEDGRQLYFNLYVGAYSDHIRVLVDESGQTVRKQLARSRKER